MAEFFKLLKDFFHKDGQYSIWISQMLFGSLVVGVGISYGHVHLFHIAYILFSPVFLFNIKYLRNKLLDFRYNFLLFFLGWYCISLFWAGDKLFALKYLFYIINGLYIVFALGLYSENEVQLKRILAVCGIFCCLNICIGLAESYTSFRWFISRYSPYNASFGIDSKYEVFLNILHGKQLTLPDQYNFLLSQPSGFDWGPNKYGLFLATIYPFFLLFSGGIIFYLIQILFFILVYMVSSRSIIISFFLMNGLLLFLNTRTLASRKKYFIIISSLLFFASPYLNMILNPNINAKRFFKVSSVISAAESYVSGYDSRIQRLREIVGNEELKSLIAIDGSIDSSIAKRRLMIVMAWNHFKNVKMRGLGAGNSAVDAGGLFGKTQIHNFWLELLFEGGAGFFILLLTWIAFLFYKLLIVSTSLDSLHRILASACLVSLVGFVLSCLAVGTPIYQPIFWTLISVTVVVTKLGDKRVILNKKNSATEP